MMWSVVFLFAGVSCHSLRTHSRITNSSDVAMLRGRPDADLNPTATKVFLETLEEPTLTTDDRKFTSVNYLKASVWDEIKGVNGEWLLEKHKHRVDPGGKQTPPSGAEGNAEDHALIENSNIPKRVFRTDKTFSPSSWQKVDSCDGPNS